MIALITGASSGLGAEFARQLDDEGLSELWLIARDEDQLNRVGESLKTPFRSMVCDLSDDSAIERVIVPLLESEKPVIKYCVNNAGFGKIGSLHRLQRSDMTRMVDVNCRAVVQLSHIVIPYMKRGSALIHTSSAASLIPLGGFAVYAATKSFVTSFSIGIQAELKDSGIHSIAICPGPVETDFSRRAHIGSVREDSVLKKKADPAPMIAKAIRDTKRNRSISLYGVQYYLVNVLRNILPAMFFATQSYKKIMTSSK